MQITPEQQSRVDKQRERYMATLQTSIDRRERRRLEEERTKQQAALEAQRAAIQRQRDAEQAKYSRESANQRANISLGATNADFQNQTRLNTQQQRGQRKRDQLLNDFETDQTRLQNRNLRERDQRQFGYSQLENEQQFQNQMQRDFTQQGFTLDRDQRQSDQTMQRDVLQGGIQANRDSRLNMFDVDRQMLQQANTLERDNLQNQFQSERDARLNIFDTQRDVRRQQFEQQSRYQAEAADISARWQEQVHVAKNAGLDFSQAQQEEMKQLEKAFRKNVLNGDLTEDLKQRAMVEHQRQMSTFVPEERIVAPQDRFQQSIVQDEQTGQRFLVVQDPRGGVKYEPLDGGMGEQAGMMRQQAQDQQRQAEAISKKQLDRVTQFQSVYDQVETILDENDRPKFNTPEKVMAEAMRRFAPRERIYQMDGLPPLGQFLNPDEVPQPKGQQQPQQQPGNPWRAAMEQRQNGQYAPPNDGFSVVPGKGQMSPATPGEQQASKPPVILSTKPLGNDVVQRLQRFPGGDQLAKIRQTHKSNSPTDQIMREATDIVIRAMLENNKSDPDLPEAVQLLKEAGFTLDLGK